MFEVHYTYSIDNRHIDRQEDRQINNGIDRKTIEEKIDKNRIYKKT